MGNPKMKKLADPLVGRIDAWSTITNDDELRRLRILGHSYTDDSIEVIEKFEELERSFPAPHGGASTPMKTVGLQTEAAAPIPGAPIASPHLLGERKATVEGIRKRLPKMVVVTVKLPPGSAVTLTGLIRRILTEVDFKALGIQMLNARLSSIGGGGHPSCKKRRRDRHNGGEI